MRKKVAVVIPNYKEQLTELEEISLGQAINILGNYDIFCVSPEGLPKLGMYSSIKYIYFSRNYFQSIKGYNELMMNMEFYMKFQNYEYILIYQLDAFVFSDQLLHFCDLGYDYIGAPWLYGINDYNFLENEQKILVVGNGGLSLRRVGKCIEVLRNEKKLWEKYYGKNEDLFFSICAGKSFSVAPIEVALQFAFECEVEKCFEKNNKQLPFGCHAWEKYNLAFWKPYIEAYGMKISNKYLGYGQKDFLNMKFYENSSKWTKILRNEKMGLNFKCVLEKMFGRDVRNYMLWGAGNVGKMVARFFESCEIPLKGFIDSDTSKGDILGGYKIYKADNIHILKDTNIIVATSELYMHEIGRKLERAGYFYGENFIYWADIFKCLVDIS